MIYTVTWLDTGLASVPVAKSDTVIVHTLADAKAVVSRSVEMILKDVTKVVPRSEVVVETLPSDEHYEVIICFNPPDHYARTSWCVSARRYRNKRPA